MHNGDLRRLVATPKERRSSTGTSGEAFNGRKPAVEAPSTPSTSQLTSTSSRSTRLSAPIAGKLADLIASPEFSAVSGGFDASSGKYVSNRRVTAIASPPVDVLPVTPEASGRSSRSRAPIAGSLADLVASPTVAAVSGGYNPETGKYSGIRKRGMGAGSPSVGEQPRE